jgi:hypothetical protein
VGAPREKPSNMPDAERRNKVRPRNSVMLRCALRSGSYARNTASNAGFDRLKPAYSSLVT